MKYHQGFLLGIVMTLSGCTNLSPPTVKASITPHWQSCNASPLLLTDLTHPVAGRRYALPNGQTCWNIEN